MRVRNKTGSGAFVKGYGVVPPHEEATVPSSDSVKDMIKADVLTEVKSSADTTKKDGDAA